MVFFKDLNQVTEFGLEYVKKMMQRISILGDFIFR